MRIYSENVAKVVVVLCIFLFIFVMISYIDTQVGTTWTDMGPETLSDERCLWIRFGFDERAERVELSVEYFTDQEFEVWLVDSEDWNWSNSRTGPTEWLGHGIAGHGVIEWSVSTDGIDGSLMLIRETMDWGQLGNLPENVTEVEYNWDMSIRSVVNPIDSGVTIVMFLLVGLAVVLLAWAWYLPPEEVPDFMDLYPDFPESMRTREGEGS